MNQLIVNLIISKLFRNRVPFSVEKDWFNRLSWENPVLGKRVIILRIELLHFGGISRKQKRTVGQAARLNTGEGL